MLRERIAVRAIAKLNVGLRITGRRADGYHDISSVIIPCPALYDELEVWPLGGASGPCLEFEQVGLELDCRPGENLVERAYRSLAPFGPPAVGGWLRKGIPSGSGLGGGSSDAASLVKALAPHCRRVPSRGELEELLLGLGSDVPYFLDPVPALVSGRGELIRPIRRDAIGGHLVVCVPEGVHISTRVAYGRVKGYSAPLSLPASMMDVDSRGELPSLGECGSLFPNDFWPIVSAMAPELVAVYEWLEGLGEGYVSLSGSGCAVFGLYGGRVQGLAGCPVRGVVVEGRV